MARKNEIVAPGRKPGEVLVPIFGQRGKLAMFDSLLGRICIICHQNDLPTAALYDDVVAVRRSESLVPAHRHCVEIELEQELRRSAAEVSRINPDKLRPKAWLEIRRPLFVPEGMPFVTARSASLIALAVPGMR